jgi:hypothetical protein
MHEHIRFIPPMVTRFDRAAQSIIHSHDPLSLDAAKVHGLAVCGSLARAR